jgi:glycine oxidase
MEDCLILGAGVIGLSIAYELSSHGLRVRVVDRGRAGQESSWAGAGILPPANIETAEHPLEQLRGLSHNLHSEWAQRLREETGIDTGYRRCGGIYLARSPGEAASLAGLADLLGSLRVEMHRLSWQELIELEPGLQPLVESGRLRGAYLLPDEAQLRNPRHVAALLAACRRRGVTVDEGVTLGKIVFHRRRIEAIESPAGELRAERFCFCTGAWTYDLLMRLNVATGILPVRGQMVLFRGSAPPFRRVLNEGPRYLVPRDDGFVLVGSTEEEVGFDKRTTVEAIDELTQLARDLVPALQHFTIEQTWAGLRPGTLDGFPYLGNIPGLDNAFVAAGHFRSGLHLSTGTAVVLSQLLRGETPQIDLSPFRVDRDSSPRQPK